MFSANYSGFVSFWIFLVVVFVLFDKEVQLPNWNLTYLAFFLTGQKPEYQGIPV